ncbi:TRCF domain-containing protein [Methylobacterium durans]|uniref:helicase-related protein n=1 Tax=Methylobacterium durans TaxID=2202825 RepID=UPI002AFF3555|nr:helicase-related protein [Methylobacterium durans]MEA1831719.1 TRCF domain-containing protein [Methylobacterium durans]
MAKRKTRADRDTDAAAPVAPLVPTGALAVALLGLAGSAAPLVHVARDAQHLGTLAAILRALAPECGVAVYPEWDCLPGDRVSPSRGTMGARAGVLRWLTDGAALPDLVLTTAPALLQRVPPPKTWASARVEIRVGDAFDPDGMTTALRRLGYILDDRVDEPGEVAVWGRTVDVFPAAAERPCRIEHEAGHVTSIRSYDPVSQRSLVASQCLVIDPASEIIRAPDADRPEPFTGQEHRLPDFYPALSTLLDYVPGARLVVEAGADERVAAFFEQVGEAGEAVRPGLYLAPEEWAALREARALAEAVADGQESVAGPVFVRERRPGAAFAKALAGAVESGARVVLTGPRHPLRRLVREADRATGCRVRLIDAWAEAVAAEPGEILAIEAPVEAGFRVPHADVTFVAAADLFGTLGAAGARPAAILPTGEVDLRIGDVAVDREHGLCVFEGLETVGTGDGAGEEALRLRFADDAILMVPVSQADRIWRYGPEPEAVSLDRLDGATWGRRRLEAEATLARTARVMVRAAQERRERAAPRIAPPDRQMERFAAGFGHTLTADQARAVEASLADLAGTRPMDRLVCGDVGFGKTEVALRAAAAAIFAGRQVAVMAPTTVLVRQHVETFRRRFARFGVEVAQLSRLVSPAEAKRVRQGIADGSVRLVVGTQALAGRGVRFHDLGLTIIDEEQRFGAKLKAGLRKAAENGHVLTLSATPIPRTLQAALVGLQELSVIATPPAVRQPIRTVIGSFDPDLVRAALQREHRRGGQSFVVCPRIEDLGPLAETLRALVPELGIVTAHGNLKPAAMDEVFVRFAEGEGDVLLATSIIESGLDVPRANTMLVWDAERFGLAQLHQLRGRVGRGQRRGLVHLFGRPERPFSAAAEKRLRTLEALDRLGAGFAISARDLDLRGAGDLVGESQAGHVKLVGLGLYQHLLHLALRAAKGEAVEDWSPEIRIGLGGRLPADYVPEPEIRLSLYTRLLRLRGTEEVEALRDEVEDRFGRLPEPVEALFTLARLRVGCAGLGIARFTAGPQALAADFRPGHRLPDPDTVPDLAVNGARVILRRASEDPVERGALADAFLRRLQDAREASR